MKSVLGLFLFVGLLGGLWLVLRPGSPTEATAARVERGSIRSVLTTNGRIQAGRQYDVFSETAGVLARVPVEVGQSVSAGATLAVIDQSAAEAALEEAQARLEAAQADLTALQRGLTAAERAQLESEARLATLRQAALEEDLSRVERLIERDAAPRREGQELERQLAELRREQELLAQKLGMEADASDLDRARAKVREAEVRVRAAKRQLGAAVVRAPIAGTIFSLPIRPGTYVTPGGLAARMAGQASVRALIFVDEPELGRVELGDQVELTADAYPGESWSCTVDRLPTEVVELETRRVGEVLCTVSQEAPELIPNLTVDVAILTAAVDSALVVPREAVQRADNETFVWIRSENGTAQPRSIRTGVLGADKVQVAAGLSEGDLVLLPGAADLSEGEPVTVEKTR